MKFPTVDQAIAARLTHVEYVARDANAKVPLTRRCAYPKSAPGLAGGCQCWGCYNAMVVAKRMLQTGPLPQKISFRNEKGRGYVLK